MIRKQKLLLAGGLLALALLPWMNSEAALEVIEPSVLCERFDRKNDVQKCMKLVHEKKADTYVASACDQLEDAKLFMQCLEFSTRADVDPRQLEKCGANSRATDPERWSCIQNAAEKTSGKFQRLPAQFQPRPPRQ